MGNAAARCLKREKGDYKQGRQQRGCGCLEFCGISTQEVQLKAAGKYLEQCGILGASAHVCAHVYDRARVHVCVWAASLLSSVWVFGCWFDYSFPEPRTLSTSVCHNNEPKHSRCVHTDMKSRSHVHAHIPSHPCIHV